MTSSMCLRITRTHTPAALFAVPLLLCLACGLSACGTGHAQAQNDPTFTLLTQRAPAATASPTADVDPWIPLKSLAPADVLTAVRQAPFLQLMNNTPSGSDGYTELSHLGTPALVIGYRPSHVGGIPGASSDYIEIPVLDSTGMVTDTIDANLNMGHSAIHVGSVSGATHAASWPAKLVSASMAVQIVQSQQHIGLRSGQHPMLIFMASLDSAGIQTGKVSWSAGGAGPQDPIWLVPGVDGQDHFVGTDGRAYTLAQLPLAPQG